MYEVHLGLVVQERALVLALDCHHRLGWHLAQLFSHVLVDSLDVALNSAQGVVKLHLDL